MANYLADIRFGSVAFAHMIDSTNTLAVGIQYVDYGTFKNVTDYNEIVGQFTAKDYAVSLMYARQLNKQFSIGLTLKPVYSVYEQYSSFGLGMDAGINYYNPRELFSAGFVFRNFGSQIKGYYSDENGQHLEPLPLNIELGASKKFEHAPLRLSLTLHNLQQFDLSYKSTNQPSAILKTKDTGNNDTFIKKTGTTFNKAADHAIIGVEFVPNNSFYAVASYNHRRQRELRSDGFKSSSGFSFGGGIKLSNYHVGFGMSQFFTGNYAYQFSLSTSLNDFRNNSTNRKKQTQIADRPTIIKEETKKVQSVELPTIHSNTLELTVNKDTTAQQVIPNEPKSIQTTVTKETTIPYKKGQIYFVYQFGFGEADNSKPIPELDQLVEAMMQNSSFKILILAYTDHIGKVRFNQYLSDKRAKSIHDYLIRKGVQRNRLKFQGKGITTKYITNAENRRAEFILTDF